MTWYGKKSLLIPIMLLSTSLLAGCGPETAEGEPAGAKKLVGAAAPADAQSKADQNAAAKADAKKVAAEKAAKAAAEAADQKAAADKAAAAAASQKAAADKAAADKAAAQKAAETAAAQNAAAAPVAAGATEYANCTELNADYPHGVGRPGASDKTKTGNPVTEFTVDQAVYEANTKSDRDNDGISCEKH